MGRVIRWACNPWAGKNSTGPTRCREDTGRWDRRGDKTSRRLEVRRERGEWSMPAAMAADGLPVEPQSLKKLSLKSLKRSLDLFAPAQSLLFAPDAER